MDNWNDNCEEKKWGKKSQAFTRFADRFQGDVTLDVVDSIKERCLQWIGRERKLTLILTLILILNTNPKLILRILALQTAEAIVY